MAQGVSGYVEFTSPSTSTIIGGTLRVNYREDYNQAANTSNLTITSLQLLTPTLNIGQSYNGNLIISIDGSPVITLTIENNQAFLNYQNTLETVYGTGSTVITGTLNNIAHNANGTKTVAISVSANQYANPIFWGGATGNMQFTAGSQNVALTTIPRQFTLGIGSGTGYTISVTRGGTPLSNGSPITYGDVLNISATPATGYSLTSLTVNGSPHTSGANYTVTGNVSVAASVTALASIVTPSTTSGTFGTAMTLTVTRYNSNYTHTITYACAGYTGTIVTNSSTTVINWTPPASLMNGIPSATSASCTITITTLSGGAAIGTRSTTITLSVPSASATPTPTQTITDAMGYYATYGAYVQGQSKLSITIDDGLKYSATTAARSTSVNGAKYYDQTFTTNALVSSGAQSVVTNVRDSRGFTGSVTTSINVLAYAAPSIGTFVVQRCDSVGTPDPAGLYCSVQWAIAVSPLNNLNTRSLKVGIKYVGYQTWNETAITLTAYTQSGTWVSPSAISADLSFDVRLVLTDAFSSVTSSTILSTTASTFSAKAGGKGAAFGKAAETDNLLDVAWNMRVRGNLSAGANNVNVLTAAGNFVSGDTLEFPAGVYLQGVVISNGTNVVIYIPLSKKLPSSLAVTHNLTCAWARAPGISHNTPTINAVARSSNNALQITLTVPSTTAWTVVTVALTGTITLT